MRTIVSLIVIAVVMVGVFAAPVAYHEHREWEAQQSAYDGIIRQLASERDDRIGCLVDDGMDEGEAYAMATTEMAKKWPKLRAR